MTDFNSIPKTKAGQLVDLLGQKIQQGEWSTHLPPERVLADRFLVSRTTVRQALEYLEKDGTIKGCSSTRGLRQILKKGPSHSNASNQRRVVFLTPSVADSPRILEQLSVLRELLDAAGVQVIVQENAQITSLKSPLAALEQLALKYPESVWILHKMSKLVQEAAVTAKLPAVVFGSSFLKSGLPAINCDFRAVARHAAGRCLGAGYRNHAIIVHRTPLAGDEEIVETLQEELSRCEGSQLLVMKHDFNRARLIDALDRAFNDPQARRPEALLIVNQHHLLTSLPHLLNRGLRIPQDLSLIYLNNDPAAERLSPLPDRYDLGDRLLRKLAGAVVARLSGEIPSSAKLLPKELYGETFQ